MITKTMITDQSVHSLYKDRKFKLSYG